MLPALFEWETPLKLKKKLELYVFRNGSRGEYIYPRGRKLWEGWNKLHNEDQYDPVLFIRYY
jgi:hypothetical protein